MFDALLIVIYIAITTSGLGLIKSAPSLIGVHFAIGFVTYGFGFLLWLYLLTRMPLSVAFPVAGGGVIVATQIAGLFFLGETISALQYAGVTLVLLGITLIYVQA